MDILEVGRLSAKIAAELETIKLLSALLFAMIIALAISVIMLARTIFAMQSGTVKNAEIDNATISKLATSNIHFLKDIRAQTKAVRYQSQAVLALTRELTETNRLIYKLNYSNVEYHKRNYGGLKAIYKAIQNIAKATSPKPNGGLP